MSYLLEQSTKDQMDNVERGTLRGHVKGTPEGLPEHFFRKTHDPVAGVPIGDLDLRLVTGEEAYKYFSAVNIKLPIMGGY